MARTCPNQAVLRRSLTLTSRLSCLGSMKTRLSSRPKLSVTMVCGSGCGQEEDGVGVVRRRIEWVWSGGGWSGCGQEEDGVGMVRRRMGWAWSGGEWGGCGQEEDEVDVVRRRRWWVWSGVGVVRRG